ncbi:MAG: cytidine deaminase [Actinobacteria bacterium]|nr:cytidine deaminase [Actinomycetota bacterium]
MNNPEDTKLVTLAASTLARSGAQQAAALRDNTGRTYVAINVTSPSLNLDAFEAVLTVALASGITGIESVVATGSLAANIKAIKDFAPTATIFYIDSDGKESSL